MEAAQAAYDEGKTVLASLNAQYERYNLWGGNVRRTASMEAKKNDRQLLNSSGWMFTGTTSLCTLISISTL